MFDNFAIGAAIQTLSLTRGFDDGKLSAFQHGARRNRLQGKAQRLYLDRGQPPDLQSQLADAAQALAQRGTLDQHQD